MSGNGQCIGNSCCAACDTQIRANGRVKITPNGVYVRESRSILGDMMRGVWICMSWFESMSPSHPLCVRPHIFHHR